MKKETKTKHDHNHEIEVVKGIRLLFVILLNFLITAAEFIGGIFSGSLSLISDSLHNLTDGLSVVISYYAVRLSDKKSDYKKTFGYKRASIMAALFNSALIIGISIFLLKEAYDKFVNPYEIDSVTVIWVAVIGLAANAACIPILRKSARSDINIKSSYLHLLSDTLSSVGVVTGGILIYFFKIYWVDPLLTVLISVYIIAESFGILKKAVNILMQGTPYHIDVDEVIGELKKIEGVTGVHHVHIWSLDEKNICLEAHVNTENILISDTNKISERFKSVLKEKYGINHITLQFEYNCCSSDQNY